MVTVQRWTGAETKALRQAMRLSIRGFAAYLGVDARTVNKWEARSNTITPLPDTQALLDTALSRAPEDVRTRFNQAVGNGEQDQGRPDAPQFTVAATEGPPKSSHIVTQWDHHSITFAVQQITGEDLSITRREALTAGASVVLAGATLTEPLQQWLLPLNRDAEFTTCGSGFSSAEIASLEG